MHNCNTICVDITGVAGKWLVKVSVDYTPTQKERRGLGCHIPYSLYVLDSTAVL